MKPDFQKAFAETMVNEVGPYATTRGYSNDKDDPGGETVAGIARNYHPMWAGWSIVDALKAQAGFPSNLSRAPELEPLIVDFYRREYWDHVHGDDMPDHEISAELFDTGVNMGDKRAGMFLQQALNKLNVRGTLYPDIAEDGSIGPGTMSSVAAYMATSRGNVSRLVTVMNIYQGAFYLQRMNDNQTNEKYIGWFDRVRFARP